MNLLIEWSILEHSQWKLYVAKTSKGLCYVGSPGQTFEDFQKYINKRFPTAELRENRDALSPYIQELNDYFDGFRTAFTLPIDVKGTPFQEEIWQALQEIPYGQTVSYSEIAARIQRPAAVRAVGTAIGANPVLITVPCHRVIGKKGTIAGYRGGLELKSFLLELETADKVHH
ncbi:methylated-DNA--[protein]-cysteine S-methyltransferase [Planococcus shenhongbingii]|uniref:Methylated-DNA--[protein]-cysteine S-methyltransferase n=1 Tax=Planococcus shenhongbingii TaxID=3058398 RepID=A0ABT8NFX3_9BACL|nr:MULTISPECIES: methylated-DNA--[protein]-cysteine S-methyltransferase [unclassified Planococcus (in: firmicutes)]MDN7246796.1 methylated-DNA--[protein]-cysteine S-methyltransferase [Planococcus sp. N017]WKA58846.1 methylated-DNA--[protein]-cysteine S-methyltransferase [Planococcus sp. N016]